MQGVGADHARLLKQRVDGHVGGREQRAGVRGGGARAGRRATALDRQQRFLARETGGDPRELARIAERLEVQQRHLGAWILLPVAQQVVARQVGLVADRHERRQADAEPTGGLDDGDPKPTALRHEPDRSRCGGMRSEGGVQANVGRGVEHPEAIRPDDPDPGIATHLEQLPLPPCSLLAGLRKPGGDHEQRTHAGVRALARDPDDALSGYDDDRELDSAPDLADRVVGGQRLDDLGVLVDGVDGAVELGRQQVVEDLTADRPASAGRPDHGHRPRLEEAAHGCDRRDPLALVETRERLRGERGGQLDLDRIARRAQLDRKAALAKHLDHAMVRRQNLGGEGRDSVLLGQAREVREQDRRDASPLPGVRDQERHLRSGLALPNVGGVRDDRGWRAALGDQREAVGVVDVERPRRDPVEIGYAEEPKRDRLGRDLLQKRADRGLVVAAHRPHMQR